ncbi:hypothetical protein [Pseudonocardia alaniniphila]|uniref:Uncharacterized protein n=1 Tax=Pseudonocardia alaniniphila TaxID=75291 RepID=A0ABS9TTX1_9PSEU|nr:hypothetical protein [Pseudonocardia alaniniphila]MCH6172004.1 hypothetical protein [Pseudonocardia alaniniphila]
MVIAVGWAASRTSSPPPSPIQEDPHTWGAEQRGERGIWPLPATVDEQLAAIMDSKRVRATLGEELVDVYRVVGASDAAEIIRASRLTTDRHAAPAVAPPQMRGQGRSSAGDTTTSSGVPPVPGICIASGTDDTPDCRSSA